MNTLSSPIHTSHHEKPTNTTPSTIASEDDDNYYETAFDKLQKMQRRLCDPDAVVNAGDHDGVNDDVNGAMNKSAGSADATNSTNIHSRRRGYGTSSTLENLDLDVSTFALDDLENRRKSSLFDDASKGDDDENEMDDDGSNDENEMNDKENEMSDKEKEMSDNEEGYTEATARFSQGIVRPNDESMGSDAEEDETHHEEEEAQKDDETEELDPEMEPMEEPEAKNDTFESTETQTPSSPPTTAQLHAQIDIIYQSADKNTMTVKQVNQSIAAHFGMDKVDKGMKAVIKERLRRLVSGEIGAAASNDDNEKKNQEKEAKSESEFEGDMESDEEINDNSSDYEDDKKSRRTSSRPRKPKKGKMAQHLRAHTNKIRRRHLEEARIRQEELGNIKSQEEENGPKLSEEDRERARAIAARFDTNREEEVERREEERVGLIDVLRRRRLEILTCGEKGVENKSEDHNNLKKEEEIVKEEKMIELEDDEDDSSEEEEELDVAPAPVVVKKPSAMDCLMAKKPVPAVATAKPKVVANSRMALRNALRAKQIKAGNRWLAK